MGFNNKAFGGYIGRGWNPVFRGVHGLTYSSHATTYSVGIAGILEDINSDMNGKSYNDVSGITSVLDEYELKLFMTPTYQHMAEAMYGQNPITSIGNFNWWIFQQSDYLTLSEGFDNELLNDSAWYGFCGFKDSTFYGTIIVVYQDYTNGTTRIRDFWYPEANRNYRAFVLDTNGTTHEYVGTQSTIYSDGHNPSTAGYGYYNTNRWAQDDGCFGFKENIVRLDGNGGQYLNAYQTQSGYAHYGCENRNSSDSIASTFYWGNSLWSSTTYAFYAFYQAQS